MSLEVKIPEAEIKVPETRKVFEKKLNVLVDDLNRYIQKSQTQEQKEWAQGIIDYLNSIWNSVAGVEDDAELANLFKNHYIDGKNFVQFLNEVHQQVTRVGRGVEKFDPFDPHHKLEDDNLILEGLWEVQGGIRKLLKTLLVVVAVSVPLGGVGYVGFKHYEAKQYENLKNQKNQLAGKMFEFENLLQKRSVLLSIGDLKRLNVLFQSAQSAMQKSDLRSLQESADAFVSALDFASKAGESIEELQGAGVTRIKLGKIEFIDLDGKPFEKSTKIMDHGVSPIAYFRNDDGTTSAVVNMENQILIVKGDVFFQGQFFNGDTPVTLKSSNSSLPPAFVSPPVVTPVRPAEPANTGGAVPSAAAPAQPAPRTPAVASPPGDDKKKGR